MNCPRCLKPVSNGIICNDGGSNHCNNCKLNFHFCANGTVKYGSPGPLMCTDCKIEKIIVLM